MAIKDPTKRNAVATALLRLHELALPKPPLWTPLPGPQQEAYVSPADELLYGGAAGGGKALALDTPLPTPDGWTTMGAVQVGDWLLDDTGKPCRIIAASPVMSDHPVYAVSFDSGDVIVADAGHRWLTWDAGERQALVRCTESWRSARRSRRPSRSTGKRPDLAERNRVQPPTPRGPIAGTIRTTAEIADKTTGRSGRANHSIPVAGSFALPEQALPLDPYVLGAWLGDGNSRGGSVYSADAEVIEEIRAAGYTVVKWSAPFAYGIHGVKAVLRELGVLGNKHIPAVYLRAAESGRRALLAGLMDTDGTVDHRGKCEFTSARRELADGVAELLHTLGIKATVTTGRATLRGKDCGPRYRVMFTTAQPVFRLTRKRERQKLTTRGVADWHYITAVAPAPSVPVRCVAVDSPSRLYLAGRSMVPTHNTDLLLGLAFTQHRLSIIFRREYPQLEGLIERGMALARPKDGTRAGITFNRNELVWTISQGRNIKLAAVQYEDDWQKYQGRPHDLVAFDELAHFTETQYTMLAGWARSAERGQRVRVVAASNPPTDAQGDWILRRWGPWVDPEHPYPARPGEIRWFARLDNEDVEVENGEEFTYKGELIQPRSRTFIPARLTDNPYLLETGYLATVQALPEPMRSQFLYGDFRLGRGEDEQQVIPTAWLEQAMRRWTPRPPAPLQLEAIGVDVARGGRDNTVLVPRYGLSYFGTPEVHPGSTTPDGPSVAALVLLMAGHRLPDLSVYIDVVGVGSAPYDLLRETEANVVGVNASARNRYARDQSSGKLRFVNQRAEDWWRLREALDPVYGQALAVPPDKDLRAELLSPRWKVGAGGLQVESRDDIIARVGRSPDRATALVLANKRALVINRESHLNLVV